MASIDRLFPRKAQRAGLLLLLLIGLMTLFGPLAVTIDPALQRLDQALLAPSWAEPFGTDEFGRSIAARIFAATRLSVGLGLISVATGAIVGTTLGIAAAWWGGWRERSVATIADTVLALPGLVLILLMVALMPGAYLPIYLGFALALWVEYFRIVRAMARTVLQAPHVQAARLLGFGPLHILRRHIAPEIMPILLVLAPYSLATVVLGLAAMGFLTVGFHPPTSELGLMMTEYLPFYHAAPWLIAAPIAVLTLTVLGLVLVAGRDRAP